jgi:hypothetical protein
MSKKLCLYVIIKENHSNIEEINGRRDELDRRTAAGHRNKG